jgi:predicted Zn-dependent protease
MTTTIIRNRFAIYLIALLGFTSCAKDKNGDRLIFTIEDDVKMGQQSAAQVDSIYDGKILSRTAYPEAYAYVDDVKGQILRSGKIAYKDEFIWEVKIIKDSTLNAFCTPGGHIYFYTGLIKYLNSGDHFAGVMGHEMAHADKRHTSKQLQKQYGVSTLLAIVTGGNPSQLAEIAAGLALLKYGREAESESDAASVEYLAETTFACNGAAGFFQKLLDEGQGGGGTPTFLSTHPAPESRVQDINTKADQVGCDKTATSDNYNTMKQTLPLF